MSKTTVTTGHNILPSESCTASTVQNCTAVYKKKVDIGEIIEQVRALKRHDEWNYTYGAGFNRGIDAVIEILERHL